MATISGPRVDVSDTRTLEYWDCTTGAQCGQLKKVTNALGHVTTFDQYDGAGRLLKTTSPNGVATTFVYNKAGNVTSATETPPAGGGSARTTSFTYDNAQQLKTATLPDGVVLTYAYDAAHRLTSVTDNAGNKVAYAYDLKDNRTQTVVKDSAGTIRRLAREIAGAPSAAVYGRIGLCNQEFGTLASALIVEPAHPDAAKTRAACLLRRQPHD